MPLTHSPVYAGKIEASKFVYSSSVKHIGELRPSSVGNLKLVLVSVAVIEFLCWSSVLNQFEPLFDASLAGLPFQESPSTRLCRNES